MTALVGSRLRDLARHLAREIGAAFGSEDLGVTPPAGPRPPGRLARILATEDLPVDPVVAPPQRQGQLAWLLAPEILPVDGPAPPPPAAPWLRILAAEELPEDPAVPRTAEGVWRRLFAAEQLPHDEPQGRRS